MIPQTLDYGPFLSWLEESPLGDWGRDAAGAAGPTAAP